MKGKQDLRELSDLSVLKIMKDGSPNAGLAEIYRRYGRLVYGVCLKYLKNKEDSEDMVIQIFMGLEQKIMRFEITNFKSWLYRVTLNECYMLLRAQKKASFQEIDESLLKEEDEEEIINSDCFEINLNHGILALKEDQRLAVELFYIQDKSYAEIGEQLSWSLKAVKSHIQNGKRNLKIILQKICQGNEQSK